MTEQGAAPDNGVAVEPREAAAYVIGRAHPASGDPW